MVFHGLILHHTGIIYANISLIHIYNSINKRNFMFDIAETMKQQIFGKLYQIPLNTSSCCLKKPIRTWAQKLY